MSYTVFALKWRPKNFDEVIGQAHIVGTLKNAIQKERIANAYLFAGPRGVGKTTTARILAKALNCKEGPTPNPCGKCPACLEIAQNRSFDVIEIDGASNRGIDEIRVLRENVKFAPVSGKFKVYIIDEVHQITTDGFNALLKTLEEPPPYVKFIFATTHPHKVIPTILSRCQRLDFRRIPVMETIGQLEKIVAKEGLAVDKEVLFAIAKASDGSLRDAESVLDQLVSFSKEKISLKDVISVLGMVEQDALFQITDKIIQKDALGALALFSGIIDNGKDIGVFLNNLIEHFRNLMIAKVTRADAKLIDLPQDICEKLLKQSEALSMEEIFSYFNILVNTLEISKRLDSLRIPLEIALVRLAHDKKGTAVFTHLAKSALQVNAAQKLQPPPKEKAPEKRATEARAPEIIASEAPAPVENSPEIPLDSIKDAWQRLVESLRGVKMSVATYLDEGQPQKIEASVLTVAFPKNHSLHKETLEKKENKALVEKRLSELFNASLRVNFIISHDLKVRDDRDSSAFIKSALDVFNGRVVRED